MMSGFTVEVLSGCSEGERKSLIAADFNSAWSWLMSRDGEVMPVSAARQSAMACMSLSAGMGEGLVMCLCWNDTVSRSLLLLVLLMWHLCVR